MASSKTMLHPPNGMGMKRGSLGRQGSVLSLTLEELQNSMLDQGKIGSMNMDEFMKNVWSAEENQAGLFSGGGGGGNTTATTATTAATTTTTNNNNNNNNGNEAATGSLQRQASVTIPRTLSQKTVEEVWKEIQVQKQKQQSQELSLGEITLEDFLIRAGVVKEDTDAGEVMPPIGPQGTLQDMPQSQQEAEWYNYQVKQQQLMQQQQQQQAAEAAAFGKRSPVSLIMPGSSYYEGGYDTGPMTPGGLALSPGMGAGDTPSKKRSLDMVVEKTVERRQRRMIKNRESAARSRARKQAYTVELEAEVTQLKEENTRLKRWEAEEAERRRRQITEMFLSKSREEQAEGQKRELRRCRSFP